MDDWTCADICDWKGESVNYCDSFPFRHFSRTTKFSGPIETIKCFEDNSRVKEILSTPGHGKVLVVDGGGSTRRALLGDLIAESAVMNGWSGVLINGVVRDSDLLARVRELGICAIGTNPRKSDRRGLGTIGEKVDFSGLSFRPGEFVYVDSDGIIVSDVQVMRP